MGEARPREAPAEKKEKKSPEEQVRNFFVEIVFIIILIYLLSNILFNGVFTYDAISATFDSLGLRGLLDTVVATYVFFATLMSVLFIIGIVYCLIRIHNIEKKWRATLYVDPTSASNTKLEKESKWQRIVTHINSENPSDWRLAILECDIVLDDLLDELGYTGGTIGDKLKSVDPGKFRTLNNAWEAHKIRNAIAHEGQDFTLTQREAKRIVGLYESVFREFNFI